MNQSRRVPSPSAPIADAGDRDAFGLPPIAPNNAVAVRDHLSTAAAQAELERKIMDAYPPMRVAPSVYPPKIAKAIIGITREVGAIGKSGWNAFHKYNYVSWDDILTRVSILLPKYELIVTPSEVARALVENDQEKNDQLVAITYEFTIVNGDGDVWPDRPRITAFGRVRDSKNICDDKAAAKCHTQAEKNFLIHFFKIRTGDTPDSDADGSQVASQEAPPPPKRPPVPSPSGKQPPHAIDRRNVRSINEWAVQFMAAIAKASAAEIDEWERLNAETVRLVAQKAPDVAQEIARAISERKSILYPQEKIVAEIDPEIALGEIDKILSDVTNAEELEETYNTKCEPLLGSRPFPPDLDQAMSLLRKHERRLEP